MPITDAPPGSSLSDALAREVLPLTRIAGVRAAGVACGIKKTGRRDLGVLMFDQPFAAAAVFTQNSFAAAPVLLGKEHLARSQGVVRALVVNSGNANACTGEQGLTDARRMAEQVAMRVPCSVEQVLVSSTGVIGEVLPMQRISQGIEAAFGQLSSSDDAAAAFHEAIQTTDAFPKAASELVDASWAVTGVCKGAGMIHPDMATMLSYILLSCPSTPAALSRLVPKIAANSFNAIHVDTHPSTNDTFALLAPYASAQPESTDLPLSVELSLQRVATRLAWLIVRDGEGATKVTTVWVKRAPTASAARSIAHKVVSSALVRTALYGSDPNWGRVVSQVGNCPEAGTVADLVCIIEGVRVFAGGVPVPFDRAALAQVMRGEDIQIEIDLVHGRHEAKVMTSDLGYRYVEVNAEYTT